MKSFAALATASFAAATRTHSKDLYEGMPTFPSQYMPVNNMYSGSAPEFNFSDDYYFDDGYTAPQDTADQAPKPTPIVTTYDGPSGDYAVGNVPTGDFWNQVDDFDAWEEIYNQEDYEQRLNTEADLMVALEALREALVDLDHEIDDLDDCISHNDEDISENDDGIRDNDFGIQENDEEISDQESRIERMQRACRRAQDELDEDRDVLILYCQQYAFAKDMVGACADILTCKGTELAYRAAPFAGNAQY